MRLKTSTAPSLPRPPRNVELDQEQASRDGCALLRDEARDRGGGAARRDDVVDDEIAAAAANRVGVHLEMIDAVLELVADLNRRARQLAALAHEMQRQPKALRERRAQDEAARLDREHAVAA